jgi:PEGA domain
MRSSRFLALALVMCVLACRASDAHAQTADRWLFVPVVTGTNGKTFDPIAWTGELERELRGAGQDVLPNASASSSFNSKHSAEPVQLSNDEVKRYSKYIAQAARHLALGEQAEAQHAMESVNALRGPAHDYLSRDPRRARRIFDNCVMGSYLFERADQHQAALRQMLKCSRSFPGFRPEGRAYPGEVRRLFEEAKLQLSQSQPTSLRVTSAGRNGCTVRLNGIDVGRSPVQLSELREGLARVQVECEGGAVGRIHMLDVKPGDNELAIDPGFDSAVHTQGGVWLAYPNERERDKRAASDAQVIAQAIGVRIVLLFSVAGAAGQDISVQLGGPGQFREVARAGYVAGGGYAKGAASRVASALVAWWRAQQPKPAAVEKPKPPEPVATAQPEWAAPASAGPAPTPRKQYTQQHAAAGAILAVVGGASSAVSWVMYADRQSKRRAVSDTSGETKYRKQGVIALATAGLGATLISVSEYFWLPDHPDVPALAWVAGAIGVSLGATAIALSFTASNCELGDDRISCQNFWADHFFGPMLFMNAFPLMTVPAWYGLRMLVRPANVQISMRVAGLPGLSVRGEF